MVLFLTGKGEDTINKDMYLTPIRAHYDSDILYNIYDEQNIIDTVIVTKQYITNNGYEVTAKALKYLSLYRRYKLIYKINISDSGDNFMMLIADLEPVIIRGDIGKITRDLLEQLRDMDSNVSSMVEVNLNNDNTSTIVKEFLETSDDLKDLYITGRKYDIIETLRQSTKLLDINAELNTRLSLLETEKDSLKDMIQYYQTTNLSYLNKINKLTKELSHWTDSFIKVKDAIESYNKKLEDTETADVSQSHALIIQFKELEDVNFLRYFNFLYDYFSTRGVFCKSIILDEKTFRDYSFTDYKVVGDDITMNNFTNIDQVIRYSSPKNLLELITSPEFNIEVIFIFDRTTLPRLVVDGSNVITYYLGKNKENYSGIELSDTSFISPLEGQWKDYDYLLIPFKDTKFTPLAYKTYATQCTFTDNLFSIYKSRNTVQGLLAGI